ncbi:hypothetical protein [Halosimplex amylolyticum]|uniref:hypothetical protein n=1 Tax=Halosimplex amylolyticum TaxID=3396616 RepID=UPI003F55936B
MIDAQRFGRGRLASVAGTLFGAALLALGVAMTGTAAFELLMASGVSDRVATFGAPRGALGVGVGVVGYLILARVFERDDAAGDETDGVSPHQSADMYLFDT